MDKVNILGVKINQTSKAEILVKIQDFVEGQKQHFLVTPNPEIILTATSHDEELFYILNKADIALADGIALKIAGWLIGKKIKRIAGADLLINVLKLAEEKKYKVAVYNWRGGLSSLAEIKSAINKKFPKLALYVEAIDRQATDNFIRINQFAPDIIFCALGSPYQEKFVYHNLPKIPSARLGLSVGGAFDFLTGRIKRAPTWLRQAGLEWLWRLIQQPKRWQRILRAVIIFPYKFFLWRFILPHLYRPNVACLLYKGDQGKYKILIVERADDKGHWQLPQGGLDGENLVEAGSRELKEEINTDKFKAKKCYKNLHFYEFGDRMSKFMVPARKTRGYKGQKQSLFMAEFTGKDSDIKINFWEHGDWRWVETDKFLETISPIRRQAGEIYLRKFRETVDSIIAASEPQSRRREPQERDL